MAGIVFPDVAGAVLPAMQIQQRQTQIALEEARQRKLDADQERLNSAGQFLPDAMAGSADAFNSLAKVNPGLAIQIKNLADQKNAAHMKQAQENAKALGSGAGAVLNADPAERSAAYQAHLVDLQSRGVDISKMPQTYTPAVDSLLRYHLNSAVGADKLLEMHLNTPQPMPGGGSTPGGPPVAPPGGPAPDRDTFVQNMMPHALTVSQATGLDPRLVLAQSALETGYGQHAPGNNYFGIKGGEGPQLDTTEAGPNGSLVPAKASFRTYGSPGESAQDYAQFLTGNPRYAGVLAAKDLPSQIEAMGKSGYATDPNYAAKLRQIAFSLPTPQPGQATGPPVQLAGNVPPGAPMPQGGDQPTGNQPGVMPTPPLAPVPDLQGLRAYVESVRPGAQPMGIPKTGQPIYDHNGYLHIQLPNGQTDWIPPPPKPESTPGGYRKLPNGNLEAIPGGPADLGRGLAGIDKSITGPAVYQALMDNGDAGKAAEIKGIVEGRLPLPSAQSRVPNAVATRNLAFQADPELTDQVHAQRAKTLTDLNSGKPNTAGYQLQAQGTLFNHLAEALEKNQEINNSPYPIVNKALNAVGVGSGDPRLAALQVVLGKVNAEGEKAFEGKTTVSGLAKAAEDLKATMGTPAFAAAAREYMKLVNGQQTQLIGRINRGLGYKPGDPRAITQDNPEILTPDARASRDRILAQTQPNPADNSQIMDKGKQLLGAKPPSAQKPAAGNAVQEGATATNPQTGAQIIYRNGEWTPLR